MTDASKNLTVSDVAKKLKITVQAVRNLITNNKLHAERFGNVWLINELNLKQYISEYSIVIEPDDHPRLSKDIPDIVALSFFTGGMGLDIGMQKGGIKALLACEIDKTCRKTININAPEMALIGDIYNYDTETILKMANIPEGRKVDVIFGGPPCQAFSTAGNRKGFGDDRGNIFLRYLQIISEIKPTYVVIENVRGLLSTPYEYQGKEAFKGGALLEILDRLKKVGYTVSFNLYNAANFGSPQIRERVVIIGKLGKDKVSYLKPTHSADAKDKRHCWRTLADAFNKMPKNTVHHYINFPEKRLKYYRLLKEGECWKNLPMELQIEALGKSYYLGGGKTGFLRRLSYTKPSPTLVTNPTMPATDLAHPIEDRPLSVEEYASIQEFPVSWKFCGSILDQYRQIGNAVPIKLGEAIAKTIINDMNGKKYDEKFIYSRYKNTDDVAWNNYMQRYLTKQNGR